MNKQPILDEGNQRQLLASHRSQLAGIQSSIARVEQEKADGSLPAEVADGMIERWQIQAAAQRKFVDDALRNLGELPEEEPQPEVEAADLSREPEPLYETPEVDETTAPDGDTSTDDLPARDERGQFKAKDAS